MAVFDAIRKAVLRTSGEVLTEAFSSSRQSAVEMADLANEVAAEIVASAPWRVLTKVAEIDGSQGEAYDLPEDYSRMSGDIDDPSTWFWGYTAFNDVNEYLQFKTGGFLLAGNGGWIILGGQLQFYPAPSSGASYPYISGWYARDEGGTVKAEFDADNDSFILPERLLTLGLIWHWKAQKGLEYAEDLNKYEVAMSQESTRDRGFYALRAPVNRFEGPMAYSGRAIR